MSRLQIRLFGPYFSSFLVHIYGYEPANGLRALYFALVAIIHRVKGNIDVKDESILNRDPDLVWPSLRDAHRALIASRDSE